MANVTPDEILDGIATLVGTATDIGVVITDSKWSSFLQLDLAPFARLVISQNPDDELHGWCIAWESIIDQQDISGGSCVRDITHGFDLAYVRKYSQSDDGATSNTKFRATIWSVSEALNGDRSLGLGTQIFHTGLISFGDFAVSDFGQSYGLAHFALFRLPVVSTASY